MGDYLNNSMSDKRLRSKHYIMSNDLRDQFLTWLSIQELKAKKALDKDPAKDFEKGQIDLILNAKAFILTEGKIR